VFPLSENMTSSSKLEVHTVNTLHRIVKNENRLAHKKRSGQWSVKAVQEQEVKLRCGICETGRFYAGSEREKELWMSRVMGERIGE